MATPREPIAALAYHDIPSNNHDPLDPSLNAPINCNKELPPMPRSSTEEAPEDTVYGDSGREDHRQSTASWMDMDSGSESDDTGKHSIHDGLIGWHSTVCVWRCAGRSLVSNQILDP
jgi:hypothetical protein